MTFSNSATTHLKPSEGLQPCMNLVGMLNSLIQSVSSSDVPIVLESTAQIFQSAAQISQIDQALQPQRIAPTVDPYSVWIERIENVIREPLPESWEPLIRSRTVEELEQSLKAVRDYKRRKQIHDIKAVVRAAVNERWKPNLNF